MATIAFIGLGNMGSGMAANLVKAGHDVKAFDLSDAAVAQAVEQGASAAGSAADAVSGADAVVTMLPAGKHVRAVYEGQIFPAAAPGTLFLDCSTIDVDSARHVGGAARDLAGGLARRHLRRSEAAIAPGLPPAEAARPEEEGDAASRYEARPDG